MMDVNNISPPLSLLDVPDHVLCNVLGYLDDAHSFFRLSWTCQYWRGRLEEDELWRQMLVDHLRGIDWETCGRLCELSGLDCRSLAMAAVAAGNSHGRVPCYTKVGNTVDPRTLGIITFQPHRLDVLNVQRVQDACVDAIRWCLAITTKSKPGQFLWEGQNGRSELLVSYDFSSDDELEFKVEGESVYIFQDRTAFLDDVLSRIHADCSFIKLDYNVPPPLAWMNGDSRRDAVSFDNIRERITNTDISAVLSANSGITCGMFYGNSVFGTNYHYKAAQSGSRARKLNPMARYALQCYRIGKELNLYGVLNALFEAAKNPPNMLGFPSVERNDYPEASSWPGWPFGLERCPWSRFQRASNGG